MIVCHCNVVRDDDIRAEVRMGADSVAEVAACSGAGTDCGGCLDRVAALVRSEQDRERRAVGAAARH